MKDSIDAFLLLAPSLEIIILRSISEMIQFQLMNSIKKEAVNKWVEHSAGNIYLAHKRYFNFSISYTVS